MDLSLSRLPWYVQIGAFVIVSAGAVFGFWYFYVSEMSIDIETRQTRLTALRADIDRGVRTARQLPEFQAQITDLERRLETLRAVLPEEKDVADVLRRVQGLATQSNLAIQSYTPQPPKQQPMYAELPIRIVAEGRYHDLGAFFDRVSKFPRIINVSEMSIKAKSNADPNGPTIIAECTATTFVMQEAPAPKAKPGAKPAAPAPAK
jgi:type IV pilus assembly protein PilO